MSSILANDVRSQYERSFATIRAIVEAFPDDKWLVPHGDEYYIPCRIAYHLASFIDGAVGGGFADPDFRSKAPFGEWYTATAETLPDKVKFLAYYDAAVARAQKELAAIDDDAVTAPIIPENPRMGASQLGGHLGKMRELAAHTGEMNKMLIENGIDDIWR